MEQTSQETPQVDVNRRRLTQAGLAAPAVLGMLASKPVLAAVPYTCTISGQQSGNVSSHATGTCTTLGDSQSVLTDTFARGSNKNILIHDLFPALTTNYFFMTDNSNNATLTATDTGIVASIFQILSLTAPTSLLYAQKALVLLLNARNIHDTSIYPLTQDQAQKLYIAAATHSSFIDTNPNVTWLYDPDVKHYIDLLWH